MNTKKIRETLGLLNSMLLSGEKHSQQSMALVDEAFEELYKNGFNNYGKLAGLRCYISGGIDRVKDDGIGWRKNLKDKCKEKNILIDFLDPCAKPEHLGQEIKEEKTRISKLKAQGQETWKELQKEVKTFKRIDYRMVDLCDLYVGYIDIKIHLCGSYFECKVAEEERKPMFFILAPDMEKKDIPTWLVDIADWDKIFCGVDECVTYLEKMDKGEIPMDDRWVKVC